MWKKKSTNVALVLIVLVLASAGIVALSSTAKDSGWRAVQGKVMPQFVPAENKDKIPLVTKPFSDAVDVGFVIDGETKYQFISPEMLEEYGIGEEELYQKALDNLDARSKDIKVEVAQASEENAAAKYVIVELDDGYAAVRLLNAGVRKAISRELGDEYVAAIPTRDFLIFWHTDFPLFDAFTKQVKTEFEAEENYPLTPALFRVNKYGIQPVVKVNDEVTE